MITKAGVAKLADLGLARHVDDTETAEAEKNKAFGTPFYISPNKSEARWISPPRPTSTDWVRPSITW